MSVVASEVRPALGVGLIHLPGVEPLLDGSHDHIAVVELEPQTLWEKVRVEGRWSYTPNRELLDRVAALPMAKLMHGIGQPLGGAVADPVEHLSLLKTTAAQLSPAWVSEHLSFNRVDVDGTAVEAGFLLPPAQTAATVRVAARNIRAYAEALGHPVAFETGVNYLRPSPDELGDGEFWTHVARAAGCGILLDLHNLWCNELNGRASVLEVLDRLPLDRVWEVHLAGGMPLSGYWLDAHSGRVPGPLVELAADVIPRLPNLGALLFEVLPEHLDSIGLDGVSEQVGELAQLWALRAPQGVSACAVMTSGRLEHDPDERDVREVRRWEQVLYAAVTGSPGDAAAGQPLRDDPGIAIYRELIGDIRRGNLAMTMRHTLTLLLLTLGQQRTSELLTSYLAGTPADSYRAVEAHQFAGFLAGQTTLLESVRHLREVLAFEHALVRATVLGEATRVDWTANPAAILQALQRGELPPALPQSPSSMLVSA